MRLPDQGLVSVLKQIHDDLDAETLAASFGRKNKKRSDQITGILATLRSLGLIK